MAETTELIDKTTGEVATLGDYGEYAGIGTSDIDASDLGTAFIALLQSNSKVVNSDAPEYISGARPGMLMNSVTKELYDGEKGIAFIPCKNVRLFVEKKKGGASYGDRFPADSDEVLQAQKNATGNRIYLPNGNELVETKYIFAIKLDDGGDPELPIIIPFSSTKMAVHRAMMNFVVQLKGNLPLFAYKFLLTTCGAVNASGENYKNYRIAPLNGSVKDSLVPASASEILDKGMGIVKGVENGSLPIAYRSLEEAEGSDDETEYL